MNSDFAAVRHYLALGYDQLKGQDETSARMREAIDLLMEAAASAEFNRAFRTADVLKFSRKPK